jgi:hypothetical protein
MLVGGVGNVSVHADVSVRADDGARVYREQLPVPIRALLKFAMKIAELCSGPHNHYHLLTAY